LESSLVVENISKSFKLKKPGQKFSKQSRINKGGKFIALDKISFSVSKGEMLGIIGKNGSGKTTLLRIIAGIYEPDEGTITVKGKLAPLLHIGTGFNNELTSSDNIIMAGMLGGISKSEMKKRIPEIIEFAELEDFVGLKLKHYSTGMRARLAFATALQINPDILLVDEILSVGDIGFKEKSYKAFLSFKERGKTIVYSSHNLGALPELCDRVILLQKGKVVMIDNPARVIEKYKEISKKNN